MNRFSVFIVAILLASVVSFVGSPTEVSAEGHPVMQRVELELYTHLEDDDDPIPPFAEFGNTDVCRVNGFAHLDIERGVPNSDIAQAIHTYQNRGRVSPIPFIQARGDGKPWSDADGGNVNFRCDEVSACFEGSTIGVDSAGQVLLRIGIQFYEGTSGSDSCDPSDLHTSGVLELPIDPGPYMRCTGNPDRPERHPIPGSDFPTTNLADVDRMGVVLCARNTTTSPVAIASVASQVPPIQPMSAMSE